MKVGVNQKL